MALVIHQTPYVHEFHVYVPGFTESATLGHLLLESALVCSLYFLDLCSMSAVEFTIVNW